MASFWIAVVTLVFLLLVRNSWIARRHPEKLSFTTLSPTRRRFGAAFVAGLAMLSLLVYLRDPSALWRLASFLFMLVLAVLIFFSPSYEGLNEHQKAKLREMIAGEWWIVPFSTVLFLIGFVILMVFVSRRAALLLAAAYICFLVTEMVWITWRHKAERDEEDGEKRSRKPSETPRA